MAAGMEADHGGGGAAEFFCRDGSRCPLDPPGELNTQHVNGAGMVKRYHGSFPNIKVPYRPVRELTKVVEFAS
ncbi:hypothetical protein PhaeoP97_01519 [Phaeobacter porticola]|uniref:Uncharacterized protein n=1 Tax=Phaeobacter porticola TaxID=1844006 RepID=A0A1L3I4E8_9RHOB|nr:hypothetical protein PhaeoP97_01519 [Phaeobacter porticola]